MPLLLIPLTADTITVEEIRELRKARVIDGLTFSLAIVGKGKGRPKSFRLCHGRPRDPSPTEIARARARCTDILNARGAAEGA